MIDSLREWFNNTVTIAQLSFERLLELPLVVLCAAAFLVLPVLALVGRVFRRRWPSRGFWTKGVVVCFLASVLFFLDQKFNLLMYEVRTLRREVAERPSYAPAVAVDSRPWLVDLERVRGDLKERHPKLVLKPFIEAEPIDYYKIEVQEPYQAHAYVSVIDLTHPSVEVMITEQFNQKWLTSDFAKKHGCAVAVNGEAGLYPGKSGGLAHWSGNWIVRGEEILLKDTAERPFLSFDRKNRPTYFPEAVVDTDVTPEKYNTLWGRYDLLLDGAPAADLAENPHARCCIGVDREGERLFLAIVDRRVKHSVGLGLDTVAEILRAFGAWNAMSCDEGGTACMYLASRQGIVSVPADGPERVCFSHLGIAVR